MGINKIQALAVGTEASQDCFRIGSLEVVGKPVEKGSQSRWGNLLRGVAQGIVGAWVNFYHQPVEGQVHGNLCNGLHKVALARNMAGIAKNGKVWGVPPQLKG